MNVQISVTIWTVLSFLALMLVLDRLLFRPLLGVMDARQDKIDRARKKREEALSGREAELRRREEERELARREAQQAAAARLEEQRAANARAAAGAREENLRRLEEQRLSLDRESREIRQKLEPRLEELSDVFARRLQSWQELEETARPGEPETI